MAGGPPGRVAAGALLPCRLHLAGARRRDRLPQQGGGLRHAVSCRGRGVAPRRRRSALSRRRDRRGRGIAYLGAGFASPPASALHRPRRRDLTRPGPLDRPPTRLLPAGAPALTPLPRGVPAAATNRFRRGRTPL